MSDLITWATENQTTMLAIVGILLYLLFPKYRPILVSLGLIKVDKDGKPLPIELEAKATDEGLVESVKAVKVVERQLEMQGNKEGAEAARKAGAELFTATKPEAK